MLAPMTGAVIPLAEVNDKVFSSGAMGRGFAIMPDAGDVRAPIDGRVVVSMGHAFGIKSPTGLEVLVHVGIDTVKLQGALSSVVAKGTEVKAGDLLAKGRPGGHRGRRAGHHHGRHRHQQQRLRCAGRRRDR